MCSIALFSALDESKDGIFLLKVCCSRLSLSLIPLKGQLGLKLKVLFYIDLICYQFLEKHFF